MDKKALEEILGGDYAPKPDENARKIAVNLAVATFKDEQQQKNKKSFQGVSILSRLMGSSNTLRGRDPMEQKMRKKLVYGGMATAMAVIVVAGISLTQLDQAVERFDVAQNVKAPATVEVQTEEDLTSGVESAVSVPTMPTQTADNGQDEEPLTRWRKLQEELPEGKKDSAPAEMEMADTAATQAAPMPMKTQEFRAMAKSKEAYGGVAGNVMPGSPPVYMPQPIVDDSIAPYYQDQGRDKFTEFKENAFKQVSAEPVSTFSSDVDTASYSFVRRQLNNGQWPQEDVVRVEEMINYFDYNYPLPESAAEPFKPTVTVMDSPWAEGKKLLHVGIKGYEIKEAQPQSNLVFLLDVSGSMDEPSKLPLVKSSMKMLLETLKPDDTIAIAVYAGSAGVVLEPTKVSERSKIVAAIDNLVPGGSTAGEAGIMQAYALAEQNFNKEGVNRIILATDGDFNVGTSNEEELKRLVEEKRKSGVFLSILGFGQGNYNDAIMQTLAQNGNGVAAYIDTLNEARKVLVEEASSSLFPIAKDVKFQVEFNPATVSEYRLVGYETRALNREDFNNDKIDAGDMGAGHTVTAIYEFVPVGSSAVSVDALRYGAAEPQKPAAESDNSEYAFVKIRYKLPNEDVSKLITQPVAQNTQTPNGDVQFSVAVAGFGQILKNDQNIRKMTMDDVINMAQSAKGEDPYGYRAEFINLVRLAKSTRQ